MESEIDKILQGLNPAQHDAVVNYDAASLIIAGAGSGKTRVLTTRIAYMVACGVDPSRILALTFTNKAAEQMRSRIAEMVPGWKARYICMGTFHSIFSRILRENAERLGYPQSYVIYDSTDSKNLLKTIIREMNLSDDTYKPNRVAARISMAKNCLVTPEMYLANSVYATEDRQAKMPAFGQIYQTYCLRCKHNGAMDFDDLLLQTNILLKDCPDVLARYQERFQYLLVDEYQDTNYAQYVIIRRLTYHNPHVCVVGDDSQSIYAFRGAKIENILSFQKDYPGVRVFKLEQNYRSTQTIVDAANSLIKHNNRRLEKTCFSAGDTGDKIRILKAYTDREEAEQVVADLRDRMRETGDAWSEAAILYRTNNQSAVLEEQLRRRGIPYHIYKGSSFYDHKEIRDVMGYIRLVVNPRDDEAFRRIVNYPARGIGDTTVQRIAQIAADRGQSMWEAVNTLVEEPQTDPVQRTIVRKVKEFVAMIRSLALLRNDPAKSLYDLGLAIVGQSGILALYRAENTVEATSAIDNIEELLNSMQLFKEQRDAEIRAGEREVGDEATLEEWLQQVMLMTDMDKEEADDRNKVTLMTVHSAKGLEYKYVYIVGMEQNLFPSQRAIDDGPEGLEEERRLFYVALTRAKCRATLSYAETRFRWGSMEFSRPSTFLKEIDPRYLESTVDTEEADVDEEEGLSAIEKLRRRYDYRYSRQDNSRTGAPQGRYGQTSPANRPAYGGRPGYSNNPGGNYGTPQRPEPSIVTPVRTSTEGLRRLGVRPKEGVTPQSGMPTTPAPSAPSTCSYRIGERVEHATFGQGTVERIEEMASGEFKLYIAFSSGTKTLLARLAKLRRL